MVMCVVWLLAVVGIFVAIAGILLLKIKVHIQIYGINANQTVRYQVKLLGGLIRLHNQKPKKSEKKRKKNVSKPSESEAAGGKVKETLEDVIVIVKAAAPVLRRELLIEDVQFGISAGFSDPVVNGILFGSLAATVALLQTAVERTFVVKNRIFRAVPDFVSEEGIKIRFDTTLSMRPLLLLIKCLETWRKNQEVRTLVKKYTKKEERE